MLLHGGSPQGAELIAALDLAAIVAPTFRRNLCTVSMQPNRFYETGGMARRTFTEEELL
jgi:hypothetical protein